MTAVEEPRTRSGHPLTMTTEAEVAAVREVLAAAGMLGEHVRYAFFAPEEPPKADVLAFDDGVPDRRFRVVLLDLASGRSWDTVVSATAGELVSSRELEPASDGQPPIIDSEFEFIEDVLNASPDWLAALAERGIEPASVRAVPLSAGVYDYAEETGRRMARAFGFRQDSESDHPWAHPIDGLVAYIDLTNRSVDRVIDTGVVPVPETSGNFDDPAVQGPPLEGLKPIEITQPEGRSFTVDDGRVRWGKWDLRIGFNEREGLTLHQISFDDRQVCYRASVAEMVVPYADPAPVRFWQNYFDCGEYMFARYADSLQLGCDCLGDIHYVDATIADDLGNPKTIGNAICMHEEDHGVLWKHTDIFTGSREVRRQRRLVISFFTPIGNYDYGFYWYLYLDGTIELEAKATGIVFTSGTPGEHATEIAPGRGAPFHQHLFSARLDMTVDGLANAVEEVEAVRVPMGDGNRYGNAFARSATRLGSESGAQRDASPGTARVWHVVNTEKTNALGQPVGYVLHPHGQPTLLADPASSIAARAAFATKALWVTRYDPAERYPAGDFVNQNPGGAGLPAWTAADRDVDGQDVVLWHTFGLTHFPRTEDWPVMPVDYTGFTLKPAGFFDRNPALDVPPSEGKHCH
ncbi:Monoamine oxidase [Pseudonocardia sp. Ae168_Ps1]|uniref:primary-amine oxidase n=1 Tax=unclassified Pseudonocardia TaxID=2619320 RepID=UPI00094B130D|nr:MULTISPECIES: primary-amine oxidase [unclassified Pseudonocardia]OLL72755.1 Monoamine oxidase [Pseudonocardia sp. Ae150A_Ps1]OLL78728.1 Monoamine oxidase [Pseudonocardia sp. Ae168_Ps1]OLL87144.1 Monoamine oxidase [Pseudonocardia sp. Ae263_Ps1]OLL92826.1 Monoamine oxidase [Pseudonocardia sp. Ae356_Ps1]